MSKSLLPSVAEWEGGCFSWANRGKVGGLGIFTRQGAYFCRLPSHSPLDGNVKKIELLDLARLRTQHELGWFLIS